MPTSPEAAPPLILRGTPFNLGAVLWFISVLCWRLPVLWRIGNAISDVRFRLYSAFGWEWI